MHRYDDDPQTGKDGWTSEDDRGPTRRRRMLVAGAGVGLAVVLVGGFLLVKNPDASSEERGDAPVALSPDGLSPVVSDAQITAGQGTAAAALAGTLAPPEGANADIPIAAQHAYRRAEATLGLEKPTCHLPWWVLAGIAEVESDHAADRAVDTVGNVSPPLRGPRLDGSVIETRMVMDTDQGTFDGDTQYDRAMGTFQMLPGTWRLSGRDGNGDGTVSPDNVYDAALSAAQYLCSADADLSTPKGLAATVLRYDNKPAYLTEVLAWGNYYRQHLTPAPQAPAPASNAVVPSLTGPVKPVTTPAPPAKSSVPSTGPTPPPTRSGHTSLSVPAAPTTPTTRPDTGDTTTSEPTPKDTGTRTDPSTTRPTGPSTTTPESSRTSRTTEPESHRTPSSPSSSRTKQTSSSTRTTQPSSPTRTSADPTPTSVRETSEPTAESSVRRSTRTTAPTATRTSGSTASDLPAIPDDETPAPRDSTTTGSRGR